MVEIKPQPPSISRVAGSTTCVCSPASSWIVLPTVLLLLFLRTPSVFPYALSAFSFHPLLSLVTNDNDNRHSFVLSLEKNCNSFSLTSIGLSLSLLKQILSILSRPIILPDLFLIILIEYLFIMKTTFLPAAAVVAGASSALAGIAPLQPRQSSLPAIEVRGNGESTTLASKAHLLTKLSFLRWR